MILYIANPKDTNKKMLALVSEFSKIAGYKIIQKLSEKTFKKTVLYNSIRNRSGTNFVF